MVSPAEERALLYAQSEAGLLGRIDDLTTLLNAALNKQPKEVGDIIINDTVVDNRNILVNDPVVLTEDIEDFDKKHGWDAFGLDPSTNYDIKQL